MLYGGPGPSHPRSTLLVTLLASTLFFAALLAYEAHDAARSERVTAERALRDHASVAAWELQSAAREQLDAALGRHFGAVTSGTATSPYEVLPALPAPGATVPPELGCAEGRESAWRTDARVDLRDGEVIARPPLRSRADADALASVARRFLREGVTPERPTGLLRTVWRGEEVPVALAARHARLGGPVAVYALVLCRSALGATFFRDLVTRHPLAPAAAAGTPNDSLFAVTIVAASGDTVLAAADDDASPYRVSRPLVGWDGWRAEVAVRRGAAEALLAGGRGRSRVPLLIALLATSAALAVVALLQLRREHELARLRADFIASVSHELRTPLAQILLFGETLALGRARGEAERRLAMDTIIHEARRLMHMVDNVLLFGRGRRLEGGDAIAPVAMQPVVNAVVAGFEPLARLSGVRVETHVPADLEVMATAGGIRQILLNLLDNALKYGPPHQVIVVAAGRDEDQVLLSVDDEGPGIPLPDRERVWSPYVRLRHDRGGGAGSGSGIGLSVVRELARSFGGAAWVEGGARGGSRFVVRLAAAPRATPMMAGGTAA